MKSYKAFVSSTYEDLKRHRRWVIERLRSGGIHVDPMEEWTSASSAPKALSKKRMVGCDLCVLLVARRRGHVPRGAEQSITQMEYSEAVNLGIDVLPFLLDDQADWEASFDERITDPALYSWRFGLREKHVVSFFQGEPESIAVLPAILRWLQGKPGIRPKRLAALNRVQETTDHVIQAVDHGHDFKNRLDWVDELQKLGDSYRDVIPDLYMPIQMIAWRIRDHSFDHDQEGASEYCCDELIEDLRALQFEALKVAQHSMAEEEVEALAVDILSSLELMWSGVKSKPITPPLPAHIPEDSEEYRSHQEALVRNQEEARQRDEEERARLIKRWHGGIAWPDSYAVAHKDAPPSA